MAVVMAMVGASVASAGENSPSGGSWRLRRTTGGGSTATPPPVAPVESPSASVPNASPANTSRFGVSGAAPRGGFSDDGANVVFSPSPAPMPVLSSVPAASVSRTAEPEPPVVKGRPFTPGLHLSAIKPPVGEGQEIKPMPEAVRYFDNDLFGDLPAEDTEKTVTPLLPAAAPRPIRSGVPARVPEEGRNEAVPLKDAYADAARSTAAGVPSSVAVMPAPTVLYDAEGTAMRGDGTPVSVPKPETPLPEPRAVTAAPRDAGDAAGSGKTMPRPPVLSAVPVPGPSAVALQDFGIAPGSGNGKTTASAPARPVMEPMPALSREPVEEGAPSTTTAAVVPVGAAPESMRLLVDETMAALQAAKEAEATLLRLASADNAAKVNMPESGRAKTEEPVSANALSLSRSHGLVPPGGEDRSMALAEPRAITAPNPESSAPRETAVRLASTGGQGRKMPNALTTLAKPVEQVHAASAPDDAGTVAVSANIPAIPEETTPAASAKTRDTEAPIATPAPATETVPAAPERKAPSGLAGRPEYRAQADMAMARARDELVNHELLRRALARQGLTVTEGDLDARLRARVARWSANNAWPADLDAFVEARTGMPAEAYSRRVLWPELALRRLVAAEREPSDAELERFYGDHLALFAEPESVRVSHIVVSPMALASGRSATVRVAGVEDWERARRLAEEAHAALRAGGDFADVARLRSHDARTSSRGGDLGWITHGQLMRQLENEAFGLRPGAYSAPIRTPMGYHILRVTERREARTPSFAEARDKVVASWSERTFLNRSVALMQGLRAAAKANGDLPEPGF